MKKPNSIEAVPFAVRLWTVSDIATWAQCSDDTVHRMKSKPGFPRAIRVAGRPRWKAREVVEWGERQK